MLIRQNSVIQNRSGAENNYERDIFSSPEPKSPGELIGWDSSQCPTVRPHLQT